MTSKKKKDNIKESWTRTNSFQKYFATLFGITKSGNLYRFDFGNERIQVSDNEMVNVSECQVIMNTEAFDTLFNLMKQVKESKN